MLDCHRDFRTCGGSDESNRDGGGEELEHENFFSSWCTPFFHSPVCYCVFVPGITVLLWPELSEFERFELGRRDPFPLPPRVQSFPSEAPLSPQRDFFFALAPKVIRSQSLVQETQARSLRN